MRIEQMPNGTYVKKLSPFEEDLINRLYQEINERKLEGEFMMTRLDEAEMSLDSAHDQIETLKVQLEQVRAHVGMPATP